MPGINYNLHEGVAVAPTILYVTIRSIDVIIQQLLDSTLEPIVTVSQDPNPWVDTFASWQYQLFVRWIPALLFTINSIQAVISQETGTFTF